MSSLSGILNDEEIAYVEACLGVREQERSNAAEQRRKNFRLKNLSEMGWGVIFAHNENPDVIAALTELLEHRRKQATQQNPDYYHEFTGSDGYQPGDTKTKFLNRHQVGSGYVDAAKVPYYLLIVGDPETIPYGFQYQLYIQYAVGRIHFDTLEEYAQYAHSVVKTETEKISQPRRVTFFGVQNEYDIATKRSVENFIQPLAETVSQEQPDWVVQTWLKEETTKARLGQLLGGSETPSLLFTCSYGIGFPSGDARQLSQQGALLCREWPGPNTEPLKEDYYFSAKDVGDEAQLHGLIAIFQSCYSGGTPKRDDLSNRTNSIKEIAPHAFVASLPKRLLSHPNGGALAIIGRVDLWTYSFLKSGIKNTPIFVDFLQYLIDGFPVGAAMEFFKNRYAALATDYSMWLDERQYYDDNTVSDYKLSSLQTAMNNASSIIILGDPAVRLMASEMNTATG